LDDLKYLFVFYEPASLSAKQRIERYQLLKLFFQTVSHLPSLLPVKDCSNCSVQHYFILLNEYFLRFFMLLFVFFIGKSHKKSKVFRASLPMKRVNIAAFLALRRQFLM